MTRVYIYPELGPKRDAPGGIPRVVEAQHDHLPQFGIELVSKPEDAEVIAAHVTIPHEWLTRFPRTPIVAHNHGLYWQEINWPPKYGEVNAQAQALMRAAVVSTAPSEWVAQSLRRSSMRDVRVVPHGLDLGAWPLQPPEMSQGYVLWNKYRVDPVCDPEPMMRLALALPDVPFVTTFSQRDFSQDIERHPPTSPNMRVTGALSYPDARVVVQRAGVYLATTRETFGIGTLEAMASGVPVVGFRIGANPDIVTHGVDGWLVEPGDIEGLAEGVREVLGHRAKYSAAARATAERYSWDGPAKMYAGIYHEVAERARVEAMAPTVSVVVPAWKMGDYLADTLRSVGRQTLESWDCTIYIDASPDARDEAIARTFVDHDPRFRMIVGERNVYTATARNIAIAQTTGRYVLPLDGDDQLEPHTLELLAGALDRDAALHIAYGNVRFVEPDGVTPRDYGHAIGPGYSGWPPPFDPLLQVAPQGWNLIPICAMFRRDVWRLTGGYRRHWRTHEDPDFWTRATSYGFTAAKVTTADTLIYRDRPGSLSKGETQERTWPRWYPWTRDRALTPGAALIDGAGSPSFDPPSVAVVIPVGPGHAELLLDAIDSVDAQEFRWWECIVVNDTGAPLPLLPSWVRVIEPRGLERFGGAAAARNAGIAAARAPLFVPLDADDFLMPSALGMMMGAHHESGAAIFCDFWEDPEAEGQWKPYEVDDFNPEALTKGLRWAVTQLTPVAWWKQVGGYCETIPAWEDWDFQIALAAAGLCSRRLALPLFAYRKHSGFRRDANLRNKPEAERAFLSRWGRFWEGEELMACKACSSGRASTMNTQPVVPFVGGPDADAVQVEYIGDVGGARLPYRGRASGTQYFFKRGEPVWIMTADLPGFVEQTDFRAIATPDAPASVSDPGDPSQPFLRADGPPKREAPQGPFLSDEPTRPSSAQASGQPAASASGPSSEVTKPEAPPPPEVKVYSRGDLRMFRRVELDAILVGLGRDPKAYGNMAALIEAIMVAQPTQPSMV